MRPSVLFSLFAGLLAAADRPGPPVRSAPADYAAHTEDHGLRIAAEVLDSDQVKNLFATDLSKYMVIEVAVWPKTDSQLDLSAIDFGLRSADSRSLIRPGSPKTIAGVNQRQSLSRRDDIVLYPSVGVTTGSWGTGTNVGVGIGTGGNNPGPASTDRDRTTMEMELEEKGLPDQVITKPVAGYLFFPLTAARKKLTSYELVYEPEGAKLTLPLVIPKTR